MTRLYVCLTLALLAIALSASLILYPRLPAEIPIHWNIQGIIDDYGNKTWAAFLMPAMMSGMLLLFWAIPWLSPKHFEVDAFRATYWFIILVITGMMGFIHGLTLWAALEAGKQQAQVDITRLMLAGLLVMFALIGNVMGKVRRNFYVGVRTPWTIASERVWNDTHRLAARLFVGAGVVGLIVVVLPLPLPAVAITVVVLIMSAALWPVIYSLILYKRLEKRGEI
jgi:immunity protein, SdpI family